MLPSPALLNDVPAELLRQHRPGPRQVRKARKQGRRGGIRHCIRRATKIPLPPVVLCNTRSLKHKMDELRSQVGASYEYRESGLMVFTETWLNDDIPDSLCKLMALHSYARIEMQTPARLKEEEFVFMLINVSLVPCCQRQDM